jgi:hypothetical protein
MRSQCDSFHAARILARVGCTGTARESSVFVDFSRFSFESHAATTLMRASGSASWSMMRAAIENYQKVRNAAAHGDPGFEAPDTTLVGHVEPMTIGVRALIAQHPA